MTTWTGWSLVTDPLMRTTTNEYELNGNLLTRIEPDGGFPATTT